MSSRISLWVGTIGATATIPLFQTVAVALSPVEVQKIAKQVTVQITDCGFGSGAIVRKEGSTYTVLTVAHAVKKSGCQVTTPDDTKYQVANIKTFPNQVDLAVFTFTSSKNYPVAKLIANSDTVDAGETVYVSGYPLSSTISTSIFAFVKGEVVSNSSTKQQGKGYSLIYSNNTLPGHSGGPVWNDKGEVIAIHGQGDVDTKLEKTMNDEVRVKTGFNLGITVNTFVKLATTAGIGGYTPVTVAAKPKPVDDLIASAILKQSKRDYQGMLSDMNLALSIDSQTARLYSIRGIAKSELNNLQGALADFNRAIQLDPNNVKAYNNRGSLKTDKLKDSQGALADYNRAIQLDPNFAIAYYNRGSLKEELKDPQGALTDYNRVIQLDPNYADAYYNRGLLKNNLNDNQGALADYDRAIQLSPNDATAYNNRAVLKNKLNDTRGELADYDRAIQLNPNYARAYKNRAILKQNKLKDRTGAINDIKQAARLYQQQGKNQDYQGAIELLKKWQ